MEHYGFLAIIPPVMAIILALVTKKVIFSMFCSIMFGALVLAGFHPIAAIASFFPDFIYEQVASDSNMQSITNLMIIGAFVALIESTGASKAFGRAASKVVKSRRGAETTMWLGGLFVWFTDSGNSLLVGPVCDPLAKEYRVSREKFAYILDATSSPICALIPIISWGVYLMGLVQTELDAYPQLAMSSWDVFIQAIPFNFYSILTLIMVGYIALTQFDFGPMYKAQLRARSGKEYNDGAMPMRSSDTQVKNTDAPAKTILIPLLVMLIVTFTVFIAHGFPSAIPGPAIRQGIALGFCSGALVCIGMCVYLKIFTIKDAETTVFNGMKNMVYIMVLMVFSWSLGSACSRLGTAYFIMDMTESILNPSVLPALLFLIGGLMSLATGSSWGTYAILMPIGLPIAAMMDAPFIVTVAAVISGGLFGDHCSPISDTTLLASMGAACDYIDHFKTQVPYALTVSVVAFVLFLIAGFTAVNWIVLPGLAVLFALVYGLHKVSVSRYQDYAASLVNAEAEAPLAVNE